MEEITKVKLYSNFVNTIREMVDDIQEYDCENRQDYKEIVEFLKHYKPEVNETSIKVEKLSWVNQREVM